MATRLKSRKRPISFQGVLKFFHFRSRCRNPHIHIRYCRPLQSTLRRQLMKSGYHLHQLHSFLVYTSKDFYNEASKDCSCGVSTAGITTNSVLHLYGASIYHPRIKKVMKRRKKRRSSVIDNTLNSKSKVRG